MYAVSISLGCSSAFVSVASLPNAVNMKTFEDLQDSLSSNNNNNNIPFRIVANAAGHRSTPIVAALSNHEILFGDVALHSFIREPQKVVPYLFGYTAAASAAALTSKNMRVRKSMSSESTVQLPSEQTNEFDIAKENCPSQYCSVELSSCRKEILPNNTMESRKIVKTNESNANNVVTIEESNVNDNMKTNNSISNSNDSTNSNNNEHSKNNTVCETINCTNNDIVENINTENKVEYTNNEMYYSPNNTAGLLMNFIRTSVMHKYSGSCEPVQHKIINSITKEEEEQYGFECECMETEGFNESNNVTDSNKRFISTQTLFINFLNYIKAHVLDAACNLSTSDVNVSTFATSTDLGNNSRIANSEVNGNACCKENEHEESYGNKRKDGKFRKGTTNQNTNDYKRSKNLCINNNNNYNNNNNNYSNNDIVNDIGNECNKFYTEAHTSKTPKCSNKKCHDINSAELEFDNEINQYEQEYECSENSNNNKNNRNSSKVIMLTLVVPRYAFPEAVQLTPTSTYFTQCSSSCKTNTPLESDRLPENYRINSLQWLVEAVNASHLSEVTLHLSIVFSDEAALMLYNRATSMELLSSKSYDINKTNSAEECQEIIEERSEARVNYESNAINGESDKSMLATIDSVSEKSNFPQNHQIKELVNVGVETCNEVNVIIIDWGVHVLSFSLMRIRDGVLLSHCRNNKSYPYRCYTNAFHSSSEPVTTSSNTQENQLHNTNDTCVEEQYFKHFAAKTFCGGDEIDVALANTVAIQFMQKHRRQFREFNNAHTSGLHLTIDNTRKTVETLLPARSMRKLRLLVGERKTALNMSAQSSLNNVPIEVEAFYQGVDLLDTQSLNKNKFESTVRGDWGLTEFLERSFTDFLSWLRNTYKAQLSAVNAVILCGGMFKISTLVTFAKQYVKTTSMLTQQVNVIEFCNVDTFNITGTVIEADEISCIGGCVNSYTVALAEMVKRNIIYERKQLQRKAKKESRWQKMETVATWRTLTRLLTTMTCYCHSTYISQYEQEQETDGKCNNILLQNQVNLHFAQSNIYLFVGSTTTDITTIKYNNLNLFIVPREKCMKVLTKNCTLPNRQVMGEFAGALHGKFALYLFSDQLPVTVNKHDIFRRYNSLCPDLEDKKCNKLILIALKPFPYQWNIHPINRNREINIINKLEENKEKLMLVITTSIIESKNDAQKEDTTHYYDENMIRSCNITATSESRCCSTDSNSEQKLSVEFSLALNGAMQSKGLIKLRKKIVYSTGKCAFDYYKYN